MANNFNGYMDLLGIQWKTWKNAMHHYWRNVLLVIESYIDVGQEEIAFLKTFCCNGFNDIALGAL